MNPILSLNVGDNLFVPKRVGFVQVQHQGVVVGPNLVLHNSSEKGEHVSTVKEFAKGKPVRVQPSGAAPETVVRRAAQVLRNPRSYNPVTANCEQTANWVTTGEARSPQLVAAIIALAVGLLLWMALRR